MLIGNVLSAQVQVSDTLSKNRFQVRINGTIKGNYSKGSCYADANSAGNIAIKFSGNDKLVTAYQAPNLYVINGQTSSNRDSVLNRLSVIMLDFQCSTPTPPEPTSYELHGSPYFDFWIGTGGPNKDTLAVGFPFNYPMYSSPSNDSTLTMHLWGGTLLTGYTPNICYAVGQRKCDTLQNCIDINTPNNIVSVFEPTINNISENSIFTLCDLSTSNVPSLYYNFNTSTVNWKDTSVLNLTVITLQNDTTIQQQPSFYVTPDGDGAWLKRNLAVIFDGSTTLDTNIIYITARPAKASSQTYATSSFKIQQLAYADINAPVITESVYNPNSGVQTADFNVNEGKNTYCVRVEDTNGNIAYTIFQVTKTAI